MKDIRMLTLMKQHYMDRYKEALECQISCWGYYDGINIVKLDKTESQLFEKKTESPISELWYSAMQLAHNLKGKHSEQNIGLFRNENDLAINFWREYDRVPFFMVGFLQLKESMDYKNIASQIETNYQVKREDGKSIQRDVITYYTFDNADLVVLMQSNSVNKLEEAVKEIESIPEIRYFHSIMGISEAYLQACKDSGEILEEWKETTCMLEEELSQITIKFVTSGDRELEQRIRNEWKFPVNNVKSSFAMGHENLVMDIYGTNVRMLVELLLPGGFTTHQNKLYDKGVVYNIETSFRTKMLDWTNVSALQTEDCNNPLSTWCVDKMNKYRKYMLDAWKHGNESLYSYYNSLLQTLNTLAQYENFMLSQDIFHLVFPAFDLFDRQLEKAIEGMERDNSSVIVEKIEESIRKFLDSVSSVIYHTIHTDQMFLMVPGYTGTTFALPVKLCLMYLWFINRIIMVLNDGKEPYEYKCLLSPEMESKPTTSLICLGLPHGDRLICVRLSQRSLYMPRNLFVILAHEIAHYVGGEIRCRKERAAYILRTVSAVIAKGIVSGVEQDNARVGNVYQLVDLESRLQLYIAEEAQSRLKSAKEARCLNGQTMDYYDTFTIENLEIIFNTILVDENMALAKIYNGVSADMQVRVPKENTEKYREKLQIIYNIQRTFESNKNKILVSEVVNAILHKLSYIYREVFSDVAAYEVLQFDEKTFKEAYYISDGKKQEEKNIEVYQKIREYVIGLLIGTKKTTKLFVENQAVASVNNEVTPLEQRRGILPGKLKDNLFSFDCTQRNLLEYVEKSQKAIREFINAEERKGAVEDVREIFKIFSEVSSLDCVGIFDKIQEKNSDYKKEVIGLRDNARK